MQKLIFIFFVLIFLSQTSWSYESMIRHGYFSCVACHNSTSGGADLNEYGKTISSSFSAFSLKKEGREQPKSWLEKLSPSLQARHAKVKRKDSKRTFFMQADLLTTLYISEKSSITGVYAKVPDKDDYYFRRLLYTHKLKDNFYIEVGRRHSPLGIQTIDHTSFIRSLNGRGVSENAVLSQLALTYYGEHNRHSFYFLANNFLESSEKEDALFAFKEELYLRKINTLLGVDVLKGKRGNNDYQFSGIYMKNYFQNFVLLGEIDFSKEAQENEDPNVRQYIRFLKLSYFPKNFWEIYFTRELVKSESSFGFQTDKTSYGTLFRITENMSFLLEKKEQNNNKVYVFQIFLNLW